MRNKLDLPPTTGITSMVLNLAEQTNIIYEELASYTKNEFLADVGGSAGLFLGLRHGERTVTKLISFYILNQMFIHT